MPIVDFTLRRYDEDYYEEDSLYPVYLGFERDEVDGCCAAENISNFPEYDEMNSEEIRQLTLDLIKVLFENQYYRCTIIFTNDNQPQTNRVLNRLGFKHTRWMRKPDHEDDTRIRMWWWEPDRRQEAYTKLKEIRDGNV